MVVDNLYLGEASEEVSSTFSFDSEVIERALRNIYSKEFNAMTDIEQNLFAEFWSKLCEATDIGIAKGNTPYITGDFYHELQYNNAVFAAFKTHRMGNDMARLLHDSNGNLKPFEQWLNDVRPIADHQVYNWFKTEYSTAIGRAHLAADWKQFEAEKDVLPNLEWMPSTSVEPRLSHIQYYGLVLPIDHPFWKKRRPRDEWGCKCDLEATDAERTPEDQIPPVFGSAPSKGLDNNPADDGMLFSNSHPYYEKAYASKELITKEADKVLSDYSRREVRRYFKERFSNKEGDVISINNGVVDSALLTYQSVKLITGKAHKCNYMKNMSIYYLNDIMSRAKYMGHSLDIKGTSSRGHGDLDKWHYYQFKLAGEYSYITVKENKAGKCTFHSLQDADHFQHSKIQTPR